MITRAFTLVEIMVAVAILAFVVLPIFGLLNYSNRGTREQDAEGIAANIAKEEMNKLMYVYTRDNLLSGAGTSQALPSDHNIKGNVFTGEYTVYPFTSNEISFIVPKTEFHDPMPCGDAGRELNPGSVFTDSGKLMTLAEVYPELAGQTLMADIKLTIKWKLPNESDFDPRNQFDLIARRTFLVTE